MKLPDFSPERIALPTISKWCRIEERFDAPSWEIHGETNSQVFQTQKSSIFFSIEDLLCLLQEAPSQLKPHHTVYGSGFSTEKQHPATQKESSNSHTAPLETGQ